MEEVLLKLFENNFDIKRKFKIGKYNIDVAALRFDKQGRTLAVSKKEIDTFTSNENIYFLKMNLDTDNFKEEMDELFKVFKNSLILQDDHYETLLNIVIYTKLNEDLKRKIEKYQKMKLLSLGLKGALVMRVIGIDETTKEIVGHKTNKELMKKLRGVI